MKSVHMNPAEAVQAHRDLQPRMSVGMHFGTFQLTTEGIDDPVRALDEARRSAAIPPAEFRTLEFGESIAITTKTPRHEAGNASRDTVEPPL